MEPGQPKARRSLPGGKSLLGRLIIAFGGLLVLIILFSVVKGLLTPKVFSLPSFVSVAQDQQEMIHLATTASQQQANGLSTANKNFAVTAQLSLTSAQSQLLTYVQNNHKKISSKSLNLKVSASTDSQLTASAAGGNYDQTFQQIMQTQLTNYEQALKQAYAQTKGPKGRQLLSNEYNGAQLLLKQLNSPAS
jgi:flagellar basal body-associated protein FliL